MKRKNTNVPAKKWKVKVTHPSFPQVLENKLLNVPKLKERCEWQVLLGDKNHYRIGMYSPKWSTINQIKTFEKHTCPEVFILLEGSINLIFFEPISEKKKVVVLKPFVPIVVTTWHNGFCPEGKFTGKCLVIERDLFTTTYLGCKT